MGMSGVFHSSYVSDPCSNTTRWRWRSVDNVYCILSVRRTQPYRCTQYINTRFVLLLSLIRWVLLKSALKNVLPSFDNQYTAPNSKYTRGECPHPPTTNGGGGPPPNACRWVPPPLKNVLSSFEAQDKLSLESMVRVKDGPCIYSGGKNRHSLDLAFNLNLTLKVKVNQSTKQ